MIVILRALPPQSKILRRRPVRAGSLIDSVDERISHKRAPSSDLVIGIEFEQEVVLQSNINSGGLDRADGGVDFPVPFRHGNFAYSQRTVDGELAEVVLEYANCNRLPVLADVLETCSEQQDGLADVWSLAPHVSYENRVDDRIKGRVSGEGQQQIEAARGEVMTARLEKVFGDRLTTGIAQLGVRLAKGKQIGSLRGLGNHLCQLEWKTVYVEWASRCNVRGSVDVCAGRDDGGDRALW